MRRAVGRVIQAVGKRRVLVTADRGDADVALCSLLNEWGLAFILRVKAGPHVSVQGQGRTWGQRTLRRHERHRSFGALPYGERCPQAVWVSKSRARARNGNGGMWHVVANRPDDAHKAAQEYGRRCGCEEGFRDAKGWWGFAKARMAQSKAWSRLFALFALALLVMTSLGSKLLLAQGPRAKDLLRRVVSRRRGRCELGLVSAMVIDLAMQIIGSE